MMIENSHGGRRKASSEGETYVSIISIYDPSSKPNLSKFSCVDTHISSYKASRSQTHNLCFDKSTYEPSATLPLIAASYMSKLGWVGVTDHIYPYLFHRDRPELKVPLICKNGIYLLMLVVHTRGCNNKRCDYCNFTMKNPPSLETIYESEPASVKYLDSAATRIARVHRNVHSCRLSQLGNFNQCHVISREYAKPSISANPLEDIVRRSDRKLQQLDAGIKTNAHRQADLGENHKRTVTEEELHHIMCHKNDRNLIATFSNEDSDFNVTAIGKRDDEKCRDIGCHNRMKIVMRRRKRQSSRKKELDEPIKPLSVMDFDFKGPVRKPAIVTQNKWILLFTCVMGSDFIFGRTMRKKSQAHNFLDELFRFAKTHGCVIERLHSDFDGVWGSKPGNKATKFMKLVSKLGWKYFNREVLLTYTIRDAQGNQRGELTNLTVACGANSILIYSILSSSCWEPAIKFTITVENACFNIDSWRPERHQQNRYDRTRRQDSY